MSYVTSGRRNAEGALACSKSAFIGGAVWRSDTLSGEGTKIGSLEPCKRRAKGVVDGWVDDRSTTGAAPAIGGISVRGRKC